VRDGQHAEGDRTHCGTEGDAKLWLPALNAHDNREFTTFGASARVSFSVAFLSPPSSEIHLGAILSPCSQFIRPPSALLSHLLCVPIRVHTPSRSTPASRAAAITKPPILWVLLSDHCKDKGTETTTMAARSEDG
jgi:hypothetical protein